MSRKGVDICDGMVFNKFMSNTNSTATNALFTCVSQMADLRREAAPEMTEDEIFESVKASLLKMMSEA